MCIPCSAGYSQPPLSDAGHLPTALQGLGVKHFANSPSFLVLLGIHNTHSISSQHIAMHSVNRGVD